MSEKSFQLGLIDGKRFEDWPAWEGQGLPVRANCDPENPRQRFLWMFTAMPGVKGAPLMLPPEYWECQSWRMCVLGAGIVGEPGLKYQPPASFASPWTSAGQWVPLDTPDPEPLTVADVMDGLSTAEKGEVKNYVLEKMGLLDQIPEVPPGQYRASDMAARLDVPIDDLIAALAEFGLNVKPDSFVGRDIADRICAHLGLD
ncbi:phage gene 29 protein family protein [Nocardia wallacei]|uniref:phage gene 29 protein family protein n=1 Tax=Nocardia wallacei TaxID=480035 RepID=UPI002458A1F9|nr:DUF2744 domain-containing protein [Nocardia wallacei]